MRMSTIDVGLRLGDAIDPFHLANGFEVVIGYECQERSNHPFSHSYDAYNTCKVLQSKCVGGGEFTVQARYLGDLGDVACGCRCW